MAHKLPAVTAAMRAERIGLDLPTVCEVVAKELLQIRASYEAGRGAWLHAKCTTEQLLAFGFKRHSSKMVLEGVPADSNTMLQRVVIFEQLSDGRWNCTHDRIVFKDVPFLPSTIRGRIARQLGLNPKQLTPDFHSVFDHAVEYYRQCFVTAKFFD